MKHPFLKMHGLGNDFVVFDRRENTFELSVDQARLIADRRFGIGCDQIVYIDPSDKADAFMRIQNADGSWAETCGNAARCLGLLLMQETERSTIVLETVVGLLHCTRAEGKNHVTVNMGMPRLLWDQIPLRDACDTLRVPFEIDAFKEPCAVNMGNPHVVFFVPDVAAVPLENIGPRIETDACFPKKTNVEFVQQITPSHLRMRVWERGSGITSACGTGACATLVAAVRRGIVERGVLCRIELDGGDMFVSWQGENQPVFMTGSATLAFRGNWEN